MRPRIEADRMSSACEVGDELTSWQRTARYETACDPGIGGECAQRGNPRSAMGYDGEVARTDEYRARMPRVCTDGVSRAGCARACGTGGPQPPPVRTDDDITRGIRAGLERASPQPPPVRTDDDKSNDVHVSVPKSSAPSGANR